jgi:hypothetical protein
LFAGAPAGPSRLCFSSVIVGPSNAFAEECHISRRSSRWNEKSDTGIPAGEMVEFEVMIRPIKALAAPGEEIGNRIGR